MRVYPGTVQSDGGRYAADIDLDNENDSHSLMIRMVGGGKRVLDVGCWNGDMAAVLGHYNPRVVGIELDPIAAQRAAKVLDRVVVADISGLDFDAALDGERFDAIVFGDVLEHVHDPAAVLEAAVKVLDTDGVVIASIPNVAHGSVRLRLLMGEFDYTETGLLDRTHVRFFTRQSVLDLFRGVGLAVVDLRRTTLDPLLAPERPLDEADVPADVLASLRADEEALTYQFVVRAVRDGASHAIADLFDRAARLEDRLGGSPTDEPALRWRVGLRADGLSHAGRMYLPQAIESELHRRFAVPVDVRLFDAELWGDADGWGPHLLLAIGDELDALAALAVRRSDAGIDRSAALWEAAGVLPGDRPRVVVVTDGVTEVRLDELALQLAAAEQPFGSVVLLGTGGRNGPFPGRVESLWPGQVRRVERPTDVDDLTSILAAADAVLSDDSFDRVAAAALGIAAAGISGTQDTLQSLERAAAAAARSGDLLAAADGLLDDALRGVRPTIDHPVDQEITRLRATIDHLQRRIVTERARLVEHVTDLELRAQRADDSDRVAERLREDVLSLEQALDAQREAIIHLQDRFLVPTPDRPPMASPIRRVLRRARRALRGG